MYLFIFLSLSITNMDDEYRRIEFGRESKYSPIKSKQRGEDLFFDESINLFILLRFQEEEEESTRVWLKIVWINIRGAMRWATHRPTFSITLGENKWADEACEHLYVIETITRETRWPRIAIFLWKRISIWLNFHLKNLFIVYVSKIFPISRKTNLSLELLFSLPLFFSFFWPITILHYTYSREGFAIRTRCNISLANKAEFKVLFHRSKMIHGVYPGN